GCEFVFDVQLSSWRYDKPGCGHVVSYYLTFLYPAAQCATVVIIDTLAFFAIAKELKKSSKLSKAAPEATMLRKNINLFYTGMQSLISELIWHFLLFFTFPLRVGEKDGFWHRLNIIAGNDANSMEDRHRELYFRKESDCVISMLRVREKEKVLFIAHHSSFKAPEAVLKLVTTIRGDVERADR
ncbi:hypothetical protein OSTOST_08794, partial [Ostertagia ostertagi]